MMASRLIDADRRARGLGLIRAEEKAALLESLHGGDRDTQQQVQPRRGHQEGVRRRLPASSDGNGQRHRGQPLPEGVAEGENALKLRFGNAATRFTTNLDAARVHDIEMFVDELEDRLEEGWCGFTEDVFSRSPTHPDGVPER